MSAAKWVPGAATERVAKNVRALRTAHGFSTYSLSRRLGELGWSIHPGSITRLEARERRIDVDDLVALSIALDTTPNRLLMPLNERQLPAEDGRPREVVTDQVRASAADMWQWAVGHRPLRPVAAGSVSSLWQLENAPQNAAAPSSTSVPGGGNVESP